MKKLNFRDWFEYLEEDLFNQYSKKYKGDFQLAYSEEYLKKFDK